jgi:hypothetical protein
MHRFSCYEIDRARYYGPEYEERNAVAAPTAFDLTIDEEVGCRGAEMHEMDCTVDMILWYESSKYREQVLRRLRPDLRAWNGAECAACSSVRDTVLNNRAMANRAAVCCGEAA